MSKPSKLATLAATCIVPALLLEMGEGIAPAQLVPKAPCPNCKRGKLQGSGELRYCQRCSFTARVDPKETP